MSTQSKIDVQTQEQQGSDNNDQKVTLPDGLEKRTCKEAHTLKASVDTFGSGD